MWPDRGERLPAAPPGPEGTGGDPGAPCPVAGITPTGPSARARAGVLAFGWTVGGRPWALFTPRDSCDIGLPPSAACDRCKLKITFLQCLVTQDCRPALRTGDKVTRHSRRARGRGPGRVQGLLQPGLRWPVNWGVHPKSGAPETSSVPMDTGGDPRPLTAPASLPRQFVASTPRQGSLLTAPTP